MHKILCGILIIFSGCTSNGNVYLCNGPKSEVYHNNNHCRGLKNCISEIEATDIATAKARHRRQCGYCYR